MDAHCQRLGRNYVNLYGVWGAVATYVKSDGIRKGYGYFKAVVFFGNGNARSSGRFSALDPIDKIIKKA
jgi:hypothetical protein